jgi:methylmalonyl-CoA/ethylmalonyl-CoA epimerase
MKVEKIECVAFYVKNLEESKAFFEGLLGIEFSKTFELSEAGVKNIMDPLGFELIAPTDPNSGAARAIEKRGEGFAMIGLKVTDLDEAITEMESKGVRMIGKLQRGSVKFAQFHPKDAYGIMLELIEYRAPHPEIPLMIE